MEWIFVFKDKGTINQGWWLKLGSIEDVIRYHESKFTDIMTKGYKSLMESREFGHGMMHANAVAFCLGLMSRNLQIPVIKVMERVSEGTLQAMFSALNKGKTIYVNKSGGWQAGDDDYSDWIRKETLDFPNFTKNQISVKKFPAGTHYYAYIDGKQVRDGDKLKWDTYEEAYGYASGLVSAKG